MAKQLTRENIKRAAELESGVNSSQINIINEEPQQGKQFNWSSPSGASFVSTVPSASAAERVNTSRLRQQNNVAELSMGRNYTSEEQAAAASASAASIQPLVNRQIQKSQLANGSNRNNRNRPESAAVNGSVPLESQAAAAGNGAVPLESQAAAAVNGSVPLGNGAVPLGNGAVAAVNGSVPLESQAAAAVNGSVPLESQAAAAVNGSAPLGNGAALLGKQEAVIPVVANAVVANAVVANAATKTATVKKYVSGQTFTPKPNLSEYKITPITSSSSSTFNPNHRTVECIKITGTEPINITETCYISTVQKAQQGGKTSKSKKSKKKRVTHKKK